jgi:molybdenum cofactor cytidylyltransferase
LLELGGGPPLVRRAATALLEAGCDPVLVVVGAHEQAVRSALSGIDVELVAHAAWPLGIAGSIRSAVARLQPRGDVEAVVLAVCDQPALSRAVIARLIESWKCDRRRRVACRYAGTIGVPALFGREAFPELMQLEGDRGARSLLRGHPLTACVDWADGARDVDDPADLEIPSASRLEVPGDSH